MAEVVNNQAEVVEEIFTTGPGERRCTPTGEKEYASMCVACGKTSAKSRCGRCKTVVFCDRNCQVKAWPAHKLVCGNVSSATNTTKSNVKKKKKKTIEFGSLYEEKEDFTSGDELTRESRTLLRRLMSSLQSVQGGANFSLDGIFKRLLNKTEFQRLVFPGISDADRQSCPQSFQDLLKEPVYADELEGIMPKVKAKADSVLDNVKRKGALKGDYMDAATEAALRPQVLQEAFGREVVAMVQMVNRRRHAVAARMKAVLASPLSEDAENDLLEGELLAGLMRTEGGVGIQDGFMGEGWSGAIHAEALRLAEAGRLVGTSLRSDGEVEPALGRLAWIEPEELKDDYPGLSELVASLHALPFELNKKTRCALRVTVPFPGCTMLRELAEGCAQPPRNDGGRDGETSGDSDTGFVVTCIYYFWAQDQEWREEAGGVLSVRNLASGDTVSVEPRSDRLVMFRSRDVTNEVARVSQRASGDTCGALFSVLFWMKGRDPGEDVD